MALTAASAKAKGRRLERWVADRYIESGLYPSARPMPMSGSLKEMPGDVWVDGFNPYVEEVKNQQTTKIWEWLKQTETQAAEMVNKKPLLHFSRNNSPVYTVIRFDDYLELRLRIKQLEEKLLT